MRMPYRKMYEALASAQGKQMALCKKASGAGKELYNTIRASEQAGTLQEYSRERERINRLMSILQELHDCMVDTDKAVDEAVTG